MSSISKRSNLTLTHLANGFHTVTSDMISVTNSRTGYRFDAWHDDVHNKDNDDNKYDDITIRNIPLWQKCILYDDQVMFKDKFANGVKTDLLQQSPTSIEVALFIAQLMPEVKIDNTPTATTLLSDITASTSLDSQLHDSKTLDSKLYNAVFVDIVEILTCWSYSEETSVESSTSQPILQSTRDAYQLFIDDELKPMLGNYLTVLSKQFGSKFKHTGALDHLMEVLDSGAYDDQLMKLCRMCPSQSYIVYALKAQCETFIIHAHTPLSEMPTLSLIKELLNVHLRLIVGIQWHKIGSRQQSVWIALDNLHQKCNHRTTFPFIEKDDASSWDSDDNRMSGTDYMMRGALLNVYDILINDYGMIAHPAVASLSLGELSDWVSARWQVASHLAPMSAEEKIPELEREDENKAQREILSVESIDYYLKLYHQQQETWLNDFILQSCKTEHINALKWLNQVNWINFLHVRPDTVKMLKLSLSMTKSWDLDPASDISLLIIQFIKLVVACQQIQHQMFLNSKKRISKL